MPKFYKEITNVWAETLNKNGINNKEQILDQYICGNKNILFKNAPLLYHNWSKSQLQQVRDIWDGENNKWVNGIYIFNKLKNKTNWMAEFEKIKKAFPRKWIEILKGESDEVKENTFYFQNSKSTTITDTKITIDKKEIPVGKLKSKEIYYHCLYPVRKPKCIESWENIFQEKIDWENVCSKMNNAIQGRKQKQFHWKTIHRALYSESKLAQMGKSDGRCKLCNQNIENISHLLFDCPKINGIWIEIENTISDLVQQQITINIKDVIFGFQRHDLEEKNIVINLILYEVKWQIWKNRNAVKYGNKNSLSTEIMIREITKGYRYEANTFINSQGKIALKKKIENFIVML